MILVLGKRRQSCVAVDFLLVLRDMERLKAKAYALLRASERYTRTDMVYLARGGFWLSASQGVVAALSFGLSILFANYVSKDAFGIYKYILSVAGVATALSMTGMNTAVSRAVAKGVEGIFMQSLKLQSKWSIAQFLALLSVSGYYLYHGNGLYALCFGIAAVAAPVGAIANTYSAYLSGKKLFQESSLYSLLSGALYVLSMAAVIFIAPSVPALVAAYFLSSAIANSCFCLLVIRKYGLRRYKLEDRDDLRFGTELSLVNIFSVIVSQIDAILVYHLLGPAQLAIYAFAVILPDRLRSLFSFISTIGLPKLAEHDPAFLRKHMGRKTLQVSIFALALALLYALAAPWIFSVFFSQYAASVVYSQVFAISLVAIAANITGIAIVSQKMRKEVYLFSIISPIFKLAASVALIYSLGLWGAIIARILSYIFQTYFPLYLLERERPAAANMHA
jgi:O-antigen/teichoic acid export membrane protein